MLAAHQGGDGDVGPVALPLAFETDFFEDLQQQVDAMVEVMGVADAGVAALVAMGGFADDLTDRDLEVLDRLIVGADQQVHQTRHVGVQINHPIGGTTRGQGVHQAILRFLIDVAQMFIGHDAPPRGNERPATLVLYPGKRLKSRKNDNKSANGQGKRK